MGSLTNTSLGNILLFTAIGASTAVTSLNYEYDLNLPQNSYENIYSQDDITNWNRDMFLTMPVHLGQESEKIETIIDFSEKLISGSHDIDHEFVDLVNENFWDLI